MKKFVLLLCVMMSCIGSFATKYTYNVDTHIWSPALKNLDDITEIVFNAYSNTDIPKVILYIPRSDGQYDQYEIAKCANLEKVTINGGKVGTHILDNCTATTIIINRATSIVSGAFGNCKNVKDVYVYGDVPCEGNAFDYDVTISQTETSKLAGLATLHYDRQYYEKYEKPRLDYIAYEMANRTSDLSGRLQSIVSSIQGGSLKDRIPTYAGWNEFLNSGNDVIKSGTFRSYSDNTARLVPANDMVYLVHSITGDNHVPGLVALKKGDILPANTGALIYVPAGSNAYYMQPVESTLAPYNQSLSSTDEHFNYLEPQTSADSMLLACADRDPKTDEVTYRNFVLCKYSQTTIYPATKPADYYAFWRLITDYYKYGYAYLHLPASVYQQPSGYECAFNSDVAWKMSSTDDGTLMAKGMVILTDEDLEAEKDATGIQTVETKTDASANGKYYNLMGVEVENPTQGIYIHNGKKVYIK